MKCNVEGLTYDVIPDLEKCVDKLKSVKTSVSGLSAPEGFCYSADLSNLPNQIEGIISQVESASSWISQKASALSSAENANKSVLSIIGGTIDATLKFGILGGATYLADQGVFGSTGKKIAHTIKKAGATVANGAISVIKGVAQFGEAIVDTAAIVGTAIETPFTALEDGVKYAYTKATGGDTSNLKSSTGQLWKNTMSFVSNDYVENTYNKFYEDTSVGQTLDNYAYAPFKSDGTGSKILSGVGYVTGVAVATVATAGVAGAAIGASQAAVGAGVAATAAFGKYTGERWGSQKEEFESIKGLSNEQWSQMQSEYEKGNISKADFERMQEIRNSDDWRTAENAVKGMAYGAANAAWEGAQWYTGAKLAGFTPTESVLKNAIIRIGADTTINAADPLYRAGVDSLTSDKSYAQAFEEQGGIGSVFTSAAVGAVSSAGGEILTGVNRIKNQGEISSEIKDKRIKEYWDSPTDCPPEYLYADGTVNWPKLSEDGIVPLGGAKPGSTKETTIKKGQKIDRYGSEKGFFTSKAGEPIEKRSIPNDVTAKPNGYIVVKDMSAESLTDYVNSLPASEQDRIVKNLRKNSGDRFINEYVENGKVSYKVVEGEAAPLEFSGYPQYDKPGGAVQYELPLSVEDLLKGGFLKDDLNVEITKEIGDKYGYIKGASINVNNDVLGGNDNEN